VGRFHDNRNTTRLENLGDGQSDLLGQALLDLETTGEHLGQAG
jgi:aspartate carbamoyltransferase catalytic subunit